MRALLVATCPLQLPDELWECVSGRGGAMITREGAQTRRPRVTLPAGPGEMTAHGGRPAATATAGWSTASSCASGAPEPPRTTCHGVQ